MRYYDHAPFFLRPELSKKPQIDRKNIQQTMASYKQHRCFEHRLYSNSADLVSGYLQQRTQDFEVGEIAKLEVTLESDRPTIAFLVRQSKLLGRSAS